MVGHEQRSLWRSKAAKQPSLKSSTAEVASPAQLYCPQNCDPRMLVVHKNLAKLCMNSVCIASEGHHFKAGRLLFSLPAQALLTSAIQDTMLAALQHRGQLCHSAPQHACGLHRTSGAMKGSQRGPQCRVRGRPIHQQQQQVCWWLLATLSMSYWYPQQRSL